MRRLSIDRLELDLRGIAPATAEAVARALGPALARALSQRRIRAASGRRIDAGHIEGAAAADAGGLARQIAQRLVEAMGAPADPGPGGV